MRNVLLGIVLMLSPVCHAQTGDSIYAYRKGSICSVMISHRDLAFAPDIENAFKEMPIPDKYNDHNVGKQVFYTSDKKVEVENLKNHAGFRVNASSNKEEMNNFDIFLQKQQIASRLIAKWFHRSRTAGICDMELVKERGYANASEVDKRIASLSTRKDALLQDAGEELIGSTFVLINDIRYIDRSAGSSVIGGVLSAATKVAKISKGKTNDLDKPDLGTLVASYKGFNVKIKTYLYQLVWDEEIASFFYNDIYTEQPDESKKEMFENNRGKFSLVYVGMQESSGKDISFIGINENDPQKMVLKACNRALDENIANLQKNFDVFKIKAPLIGTEPLRCEIGKKEGVTEKSQFEVLEIVEDENGHIDYKRRGVIQPVKGKIWDNRFMAVEEGAEGATLGYTTFETVRGSGFYPGMLIRQMK